MAEDQDPKQGEETTRLQEAAYNSQLAAGLPTSELAHTLLRQHAGLVGLRQCGAYIHAIQHMDWFTAAFTGHAAPVIVVGGRGNSHADAAQRRVKIGTNDRSSIGACEHACLHELAHIVTPDHGPGKQLREPAGGRDSSKGHHHAWRANFILIVRQALGRQAAQRLRHEFNQWGLPTHR